MLPTSPTLGGRSVTRFLPEPFLFFLADRQEDQPPFWEGARLDPLGGCEGYLARSGRTTTPYSKGATRHRQPASSTYVPVYSDWVPPVEANSHVTYAAQWFESDACEAVGDKDDGPAPRPTKGLVEALSS
jgi:hypothetical protein